MKDKDIVVEIIHEVDGKVVTEPVDDVIQRDGVEYHIMEIAGQQMEIRVANQSDVEAFKANKRSLYDK